MLGRTLTGTKARIRPFNQSSKEMNFQVFSTGQERRAGGLLVFCFCFLFETGFHYAPEVDSNLAAILLLQPPKCLYTGTCHNVQQAGVSKVQLADNKSAGQELYEPAWLASWESLKGSLCAGRWKDRTLCQLFYNFFFF